MLYKFALKVTKQCFEMMAEMVSEMVSEMVIEMMPEMVSEMVIEINPWTVTYWNGLKLNYLLYPLLS